MSDGDTGKSVIEHLADLIGIPPSEVVEWVYTGHIARLDREVGRE